MNYVRRMTSKGQVTIPAAIRKALGLKPSDKVTFRVDADGVRIEPARGSLLAGYGAVKLRGGTKDIERVRRETERWVAERALKRGR
jgi:antitoxin PrlF